MAQGDSEFAWRDEDGAAAATVVDYQAEWKSFRRRRNIALLLLAAWVPVCVGLFELSRHAIHQPVACVVAMAVWLACALAAVWWTGEFRCPRCRRRYAALGYRKGSNLTGRIFDKVCSNCKLTKFENG